MSEDTDHVLKTIDGALRDWATSGDAMRWTPEPETVSAPTAPGWSVGFLVDDMPPENGGDRGLVWQASPPAAVEALTELSQRVQVTARALRSMGTQMSRAADQATQVMSATTRQLIRIGAIPARPPADVRERALWFQQNRNTGPTTDPFARRGRRTGGR